MHSIHEGMLNTEEKSSNRKTFLNGHIRNLRNILDALISLLGISLK